LQLHNNSNIMKFLGTLEEILGNLKKSENSHLNVSQQVSQLVSRSDEDVSSLRGRNVELDRTKGKRKWADDKE
jgi:hypothetical protein